MITNFERITTDITEDERRFIPVFINYLKQQTKPVKAPEIVWDLKRSAPFQLTEVRIRKMANKIRTNGVAPLMATSKGYYISYSPDEIERQIQSLYERAASIRGCADGMRRFLEIGQMELF